MYYLFIPDRIQIDSLVHIETRDGLNLDCLFYLSSHLVIFLKKITRRRMDNNNSVAVHVRDTEHNISWEKVKINLKEDNKMRRKIKEAIKIIDGPDNPDRSEESIRSLEKGTTYKYLGLEQLFEVDDSKVKACLINELRRRLHKVWGSHLNGRNAAEASNTGLNGEKDYEKVPVS